MDRVILHSDMNSCYASIELLHHPEWRGRPLAVGGDPETRHGIVLAKEQLAKKAGVKTGMALWEARQVCPDILFVPPHYDLYLRFSRLAHSIYGEYTDRQEAFGIDESWLDCTESTACRGDGMAIAQEINRRVREELGITVSIGVSWNKVFAKFGSDYKKPDATTASVCGTGHKEKALAVRRADHRAAGTDRPGHPAETSREDGAGPKRFCPGRRPDAGEPGAGRSAD